VGTDTLGLSDQLDDSGVLGSLPESELAQKIVTHTPAHLQQEYEPHRKHILALLQRLLTINEGLSGFCTDPRSIVELSVLPENQSKVYRRQYTLARSLYKAIDECIQRWLSSGRITRNVPRHCIYNSPLLAAPKKDSEGKLTGVRVCIDVRLLNTYLV
jgi:hypothetical protein